MNEPLERRAVIRGIGQSAVGRRLGRSDLDLTLEAAREAVDDAGLTFADIDGLSTYPGGDLPATPGFTGPGTPVVQEALRLRLNWHSGGPEGAAQIQAVINACLAVATGLARHVLVYRTVTESSSQVGGRGGASPLREVGPPLEWLMPAGALSAVQWLALVATRHAHEFGTTREQLAQIPLTCRRNATDNPKAVYTTPLTMADYLAARMISTPLCLYDCDVPVDGSTAFVVSHVDTAADAPHPPVHVNAVGTALRHRNSWTQWPGPTQLACHDAADHMWERTDLKPTDVDTAQLYDGFSILTLLWLEALGFCGPGESGPYVADGHRIARDGELPLNTHGGQLSAGRLHGFSLLHEACLQLRGDAGPRQLPRPPHVAVVGNGGGPIGGCILLTAGPP
ncbi:thiolase family protein [Frankia sp. Cas3]|uniref:thiolase family protein n=1 Tax=Frankia sp. Cas3 TaxID=3073926 RepID=UPI002AD515EC|nr:thiolase family protein [Frankia sp. Cas3]